MSELRGLPSLPLAHLDQRRENLRTIENPEWNMGRQREAIIRDALKGNGPMTLRVESAATILSVSARTVRRLIARYTASAQTTSLIAHVPGPKKSHRRLGPEIERIIDAAIQTHYLVRPRKPMESDYSENGVNRTAHLKLDSNS